MAKHHKEKMHHRDGLHHKKMHKSGDRSFVEGHDPMEGRGDFANMPQDVKMHPFPKPGHYEDPDLDDTIDGIDEVMSQGTSQAKRYLSNQK